MSIKGAEYDFNIFPSSVTVIYSWSKVSEFILLRELVNKERAFAIQLHKEDNDLIFNVF